MNWGHLFPVSKLLSEQNNLFSTGACKCDGKLYITETNLNFIHTENKYTTTICREEQIPL